MLLNQIDPKHIIELIAQRTDCHIYCKDKNNRYQWCNKKLAEVFKLENEDCIFGKNDYDLYDKDLAEEVYKVDRQVLDKGNPCQFEESGIDKDGKEAIYLSTKSPLINQGKIVGLIGISMNITQRKQAERAKSAFIMNMAHDIRTPFSGIVGLAQCQAMYGLKTPEEVKDHGKMIYQSGNQLLEILDSVIVALDKNHVDDIKKDKIDLYEFSQEMQELITPSISINNLEFELKADENIGEIITDKIRLKQILANILSNAVKFTPKGKVTLSFEKTDKLKIKVSDTGIGIHKNNYERIFDKFEKVKPSYKSATFTGCGIGLYLVKQLLEDLKGTITLESELGKGSTFVIKIPSDVVAQT